MALIYFGHFLANSIATLNYYMPLSSPSDNHFPVTIGPSAAYDDNISC